MNPPPSQSPGKTPSKQPHTQHFRLLTACAPELRRQGTLDLSATQGDAEATLLMLKKRLLDENAVTGRSLDAL